MSTFEEQLRDEIDLSGTLGGMWDRESAYFAILAAHNRAVEEAERVATQKGYELGRNNEIVTLIAALRTNKGWRPEHFEGVLRTRLEATDKLNKEGGE